jgi:hypothetical protein
MVVSRPRASIWQMGMQNGFMGCILFAWASGSTSAYAQDVFVTVASQPVEIPNQGQRTNVAKLPEILKFAK